MAQPSKRPLPFSNENPGGIARELDAAHAEIARLRAENEQLRAAVKSAIRVLQAPDTGIST